MGGKGGRMMGSTVDDSRRRRAVCRSRRMAAASWLLAAAVSTALLSAAVSGTAAAAAPTQGCMVDEGAGVLWDWSMGAPPPIQTPGPDWRLSLHPTNPMLNFFVPGDWSSTALAAPDWLAGSWQGYDWSGVRVASPDGTTGVEIASTPVTGVHDSSVAVTLGVGGVFGAVEPTVLCTGDSTALGSSIVVAESGGTLAYVTGYAFPDAMLGQTVLVYYAAFAPTATFAATTQSTFIPVFYQFYRNGGTDSNEDDGSGSGDDGDNDQGPDDTTG